MQELDTLNNKLDLLIKKYAGVQAENRRLKETVAAQTLQLTGLNERLAKLEEHMSSGQPGSEVLDEAGKNKMKKQLDTVIGEIDKILGTLNE